MGQSEERLRYILRNAFRIEGTIQTKFHTITITDHIFGGAKGCVDRRKRFDGTYGYL